MTKCPFCELKSEQNRIIRDGQLVRVILSNPRLMPGHMLVVPKRHVEHLSDLTEAERRELFDVAIGLQKQVMKKLAPGCDISQHDRPFLPQGTLKVDHLHLHVRPRDSEDELYFRSQIFEKGIFKELPEVERQRFAEMFAHAD